MKDLKQLINITNRKRVGKIDILQNPLPSNSKQAKLYNVINKTDILEEDAIAEYLYGESASHSNNRFAKLKSRLKQKLLNTILFIEPTDKLLKLKTHSYKQLYFGKVLQFLGSYTLAKKILKKAIGVAEKIELFDVAYDATFQLVSIAALTNSKNEFNTLSAQLRKYERLKTIQLNAKCKYYELTLDIRVTNKVLLEEAIQEITAYDDYKNYFSLKEQHYRLKVIQHQFESDFNGLIDVCTNAINELKQHEYFPRESYFFFKYAALYGFYKLNRYKEGIEFIEKLSERLKKYKPVGHNLHLVKKYEVLYSFGELNFEDAYQNTVEFMSSKAFKNQNSIVKEFWKLYHAYAEWGLRAYSKSQGIYSIKRNDVSKRDRFRLYKFLNEVPELSKDKVGYNISLLIIQFLYNLLEGNHSEIIQKIDAIKVYKSRYLKDKSFKRSNTFISMLIKIERLSFRGNEIALSNSKGYQYLKDSLDNMSMEDCEIIPYDKLWKIIINLMANKKGLAQAI